MAEALAKLPRDRAAVSRLARTNLAAWEGQVLRRRAILDHGDKLWWTEFGPDGRVLMSTGGVMSRLWDVASGQALGPPLDHPDYLLASALSPDGRLVATLCHDGIIRIWTTATGRLAGPILIHGRPPAETPAPGSVAFSADGRLLVSCVGAGAKLWDVIVRRGIELPHEADNCRAARFSKDGRRLVLVDFDEKMAQDLRPD